MTNEQLVSKIRDGFSVSENMQTLYENNLPLIRKFIKPFSSFEPMEDLLQESYFGLRNAVDHYETSENVLFMTYARFWIIQAVQIYLDKCGSLVRIPKHTRQKIARFKKAIERIEKEQGRTPTTAEISSVLGISEAEVQEIKIYMQDVVSLDAPASSDDNNLTLSDTLQADLSIENDTIDKMYGAYSENELWGIVEHFTTERENHIIREIFINNKPLSVIAKDEGISLTRVNQIRQKGIQKLQIGKARRILEEKFDVIESKMYRGSFKNFRNNNDSSMTERLALHMIWAEDCYKRHLAEVEEMQQKRE